MNKKEIGHPCLVCTCTVSLWLVCTVICIVVYHPNCLQCFDAVGWQQWHTRVCVYHPTVLQLVPNYFLHIHSVIYLNWRTWGHVCSSSSVGVVMVTAWLCVCLSGFVAILWQHLWMWPCCDSVFVCLSGITAIQCHDEYSVCECGHAVTVCLSVCLSLCLSVSMSLCLYTAIQWRWSWWISRLWAVGSWSTSTTSGLGRCRSQPRRHHQVSFLCSVSQLITTLWPCGPWKRPLFIFWITLWTINRF